MTHWSRNFVGLPWARAGRSRDGVDCYGLPWLVYRDVLGIALPSYAGETMDAPERLEIADLISGSRRAPIWRDVTLGSEREFDLAVFRHGGIESHVGLVTARGRMLHVVEGQESYVEAFDQGRWKAKLVGLHRHQVFA